MKKTMFLLAGITCVLSPLFGVAYHFTQFEIFDILMITAVTMFYHLVIRLVVGYSVAAVLNNNVDHNRWWFRERPFERRLYKLLRVKSWKNRMPTFDESLFDISKHSPSEILGAMCQSEIVHEINVPFSFVPLAFSLWWGTFPVFLITSIVAALFDACFVIMQRYNRPRIKKILSAKGRK